MIIAETIAVAFSMFSALPVPNIRWNKNNMRYVMCAFPLVGVVIGGASAFWVMLCQGLALPVLLRGAGLCLIPVLITGGIHLDGFADTCDALASNGSQEKRQEILSDPHLGAFAAIKLCCYFVASWALWSSLPRFDTKTLCAVSVGFCLSRTLSGFAVASFPMAKDTGLVHAFAEASDKKAVKLCLALLTIFLSLGLLFCGWGGAAMAATAAGTFIYFRRMTQKQFGGLSGDLSGWFLQSVELAMLAALSAVQFLEALI
ncbi:MAG: adenosylcobinamide-GDP ribazoletransferase [Angelakisella sp.]